MGVTFSSIYYRLFGRKVLRIVMFGLDNAGKTTILYRLKLGEVVSTIPTMGFNVETVTHKNINLIVCDFGAGADKMRPVWFHYVRGSQAVIFVIDSTDRERIDEAECEIRSLVNLDGTENIVLLVIANKQDVANAMTQDEVTHRLRLNELAHRKWHVQLTSATEGYGLNEALDWLLNELDS